jgi:hypothetical protein
MDIIIDILTKQKRMIIMNTKTQKESDTNFYDVMGKDFTAGAKYAFSLLEKLAFTSDKESLKTYMKEQLEIIEEMNKL